MSFLVFITSSCKKNSSTDLKEDQTSTNDTDSASLKEKSGEFEGFIDYGSPVEVTSPNGEALPEGIMVTESGIEYPVFTTEQLKKLEDKESQKTKRAEQGGAGQPATAP